MTREHDTRIWRVVEHHVHAARDQLDFSGLEGIDSLIQAAKARARGYRSKAKMITIIYLTATELQLLSLTSPTPTYMSSR